MDNSPPPPKGNFKSSALTKPPHNLQSHNIQHNLMSNIIHPELFLSSQTEKLQTTLGN